MQVKRISARDTYPLRHKILRPHGPLSACEFPGDEDELTFHLGAFVEGKLASVASFYFENHDLFKDHPHHYRLRGMATLKEFRKKGLSSALLRTAFPLIKNNQCSLLWCNARSAAQGYYQSMGFETHGEEFEIEGIGPHYLMSKSL